MRTKLISSFPRQSPLRNGALLIALCALVWSGASAYAQSSTHANSVSTASNSEDNHEEAPPIILSKGIDLPDFSIFPGKNNTFKSGWQYTKLPGSVVAILQYACKDQPAVVLNWYRGYFDANKWNYSNLGQKGIRARSKSGHQCDINLLSKRQGEGCRYQINFRILPRAMH